MLALRKFHHLVTIVGLLSLLLVMVAIHPSTVRRTEAASIIVPDNYPTIQAAITAASPGDTITVRSGTYRENITITKPITLTAESYDPAHPERNTTIIDGGSTSSSYTIRIPAGVASRPTIRGFVIRNADDVLETYSEYILEYSFLTTGNDLIDNSAGSGGIIRNNVFLNAGDDAVDIDDAGKPFVIENNRLYNSSDDGIEIRFQPETAPSTRILIRISNNEIVGSGGDGLQLIGYGALPVDTNRSIVAERNLFARNSKAGIGMLANAVTTDNFTGGDVPEPVYTYNNTFYNNSYGLSGGDNHVAFNNLIVTHNVGVSKVQGDSGEVSIVAYTLFYQDTTTTNTSTLGAGNLINIDPLFVSLPSAGSDGVWETLDDNYSGLVLRSGSPAIDAGVAQYQAVNGVLIPSTPITGFSGRAPDLGWRESTGTAPSTTSTPVTNSSPTPRPTNTPVPQATATRTPVVTSSPTPRPTNTSVPQATTTPLSTPIVSATGAYYVDCASGNDANSGTSETQAWRTLTKASTAPLNPGNRLLLKRGCLWSDQTLTLSRSGLAGQEILVGAYGTGDAPRIQRQTTGTSDVRITGSYLIIENIQTSALPPSVDTGCQNNPEGNVVGFSFETGSHDNILRNSSASGLYAGVFIRSGSHHNHILYNQFVNNIMMSPLDPGGSGDAGAFGILLWGDDNEIAFNRISGSDACSYDYGRDGSAIEIYGGQRNSINRNIAINDDVFTELGNPRSSDNSFAYNMFSSTLNESIFLVTRGSSSSYGPVYRTRMLNNTVYLTGAQSQGFVCHAGCSTSVLFSRNNIIQAVSKVGYADAAFDEDYNIYWGGISQFTLGAHSRRVDPRFVNPGSGDFHLQSGSPAIDIGVSVGYGTDMDGNPVPSGSAPDLGAYECRSGSIPSTPTSTPIVAPTSTGTPKPTNTPLPTATTVRSTPTSTPVVAPTSTGTPRPTNTPLPTATTTIPLPTATALPTGGTTLQFASQADARVVETNLSGNYGTATSLRVDAGSDPDVESYLRFSVAGGSGSVISAKLRIYATDATANGPAVYGTSSSWVESGTGAITWSTRPARSSGAADNLGTVSASTWMELNVTSLVTGNGTYSFVLTTDNTDGLDMASRETGTPPQLVVVFSGTSPVVSTATAVPPTATSLPLPTATVQPLPTATVQPLPTTAPQTPGTLSGLKGEYFSGTSFGTLVMTRIDPAINFDWAYGAPDPTVGVDNFSTRWTGQVVPRYSETYTFYTQADDGVRLWINDQLLVDNWTMQAVTEKQGQIALTAGQPATIRLEFYEGGSHAVVKLLWSSASQAKEIIPQSQLLQPSVATVLSTPVAASVTATQLVEAETVQTVGTWTSFDSANASGGRYIFSSGAANEALIMPFFGTSVDIVYIQHPALGSFAIEIDGTVVQTINSTASTGFGVRASVTGLSAAQHTLRIVAINGTAAIDALYIEPQTVPSAPIVAPTLVQPTQPAVVVLPTNTLLPTATPLPVSIPYTDAFESGLGWTLSGVWRMDMMAGYSGAALFADTTQRGQSSVIEFGPAIMLGAAPNPTLSFWQKSGLTSGDLLAVEISIDNGLSWVAVEQQFGAVADWTEHRLDLTVYHGQTIRLRFRVDTTGIVPQGMLSIGLWIDNLTVQDAPAIPTATPFVPTMAPTIDPMLVTPTLDPLLVTPTVDPALAVPTAVPAQ